MKKIRLFFVLVALGITSSLFAQTKDNPWTIGLYFVKTEYLGDMRKYQRDSGSSFEKIKNTTFDFDMFYPGGALSFDRYLNRFFDAGLYLSYSSIGYDYKRNYMGDESRRNFEAEGLANGNLHIRWKILGNDSHTLVPYVTLGGGALMYNGLSTKVNANTYASSGGAILDYGNPNEPRTKVKYKDDPAWAGIATGGVGLEVRVTPKWSIRYQADLSWTSEDKYDFMERHGNDFQLQHNLGVTFSFGKAKDSDKDGVPDKLDKCPNTPVGVQVDENGCPVDSDGDGVPDYLDKCPNTPKNVKVDSNGCPVDSDGDGVPDYLDKCPDTPAGVKVDSNGCPIDSDGDGVADYLDKCPNTPAGVKVDADGCPIDTDGDGIPDYLDKCPTVKGVPENDGCPEVTEKVKQTFEKALHGIQFETGKYAIKKTSYGVLDEIAIIMKENPDYRLEINGHTDSTGDPVKNMTLSKNRADAVKDYLVSKGVQESRMKSQGFGDTIPIADNKTAAGRTQNRRVEFIVNFEK